jgi:hypothetical protein
MIRRILGRFRTKREQAQPSLDLPTVAIEDIEHMLVDDMGIPQLDWGMALDWIEQTEPDPWEQLPKLRAVGSAWLQAIRRALTTEHTVWRAESAEGLSPADAATRLQRATANAASTIGQALVPLRGKDPVFPFCVVALKSYDDYLSFHSHFDREGESATSGGSYLRREHSTLPCIVLPMSASWAAETTIAHEFTHHALADLELPLWIEEGLAQMMEERIGGGGFVITHDKLEQHRECWEDDGFGAFWNGDAFHSPEGHDQRLAYELAQFIVRSMLLVDATKFFAFAKDAAWHDGGASVAEEHWGVDLDEYARRLVYQ